MIDCFGANLKVLSNYESDYVMDWTDKDLEQLVKEK